MWVLLESFLAALAMVYIVFAMPELGAENDIYASTYLASAAPLSTPFNKGGPGSMQKKIQKGGRATFLFDMVRFEGSFMFSRGAGGVGTIFNGSCTPSACHV